MVYRQINKNHTHPDYGAAVPMLLVTADRRHLESVKSPFLGVVQRYPEEIQSVDYFYQSILPLGSHKLVDRTDLSRDGLGTAKSALSECRLSSVRG